MALSHIEGNLKQLPTVKSGQKDLSKALGCWTIGGIGEVIGFWALHKAKFWRIVKPLRLQGIGRGNTVTFISPNQIRQGLVWLPSSNERYYRKILTEEQINLTFRWDFLALKPKAPCLIKLKLSRRLNRMMITDCLKKRIF